MKLDCGFGLSALAEHFLFITGDVINIISPELGKPPFGQNSQTTASHTEAIELSFSYQTPSNYLIIHPDILFPMTSLAGAVGCRRKPLVMDLVKGSSGYVTVIETT